MPHFFVIKYGEIYIMIIIIIAIIIIIIIIIRQGDSLCRVFRKVDETIDHIVSGKSKFAQKEYKRKHDNLGKLVHQKLARKCNFEAGE